LLDKIHTVHSPTTSSEHDYICCSPYAGLQAGRLVRPTGLGPAFYRTQRWRTSKVGLKMPL